MGRNPINNRLDALQCFGSLKVRGILICLLAISTGCSKLGTQHGLNQRALPFNKAAAQRSQQPAGSQPRHQQTANRLPNNPVRQDANAIQSVKSRPPKLSKLPTTTLYAEPVVSAASQASWEDDVNAENSGATLPAQSTFDPTAEPPAQIFAQPVQAVANDTAPAARVADSRILTPMLFNSKTREVTPTFKGSLRDRQAQTPTAPPAPITEEIPKTNQPIQPLLVVDDQSDTPPLPTKIAEVSPFPLVPKMEPVEVTPADDPVVSSESFVSHSNMIPLTPISTEESNGPLVDSDMGFQSNDYQSAPQMEVVESDVSVAAASESTGIKIDANLAAGFDAFPAPKAPQLEPMVINVESLPPPLPTKVEMPVLDPPAEQVMVESVPEVEFNQVAESDFEPVPQQSKLPDTALFAENIPDFDPGRSVVPMPVKVASLPDANLVKKNFANVTFSPTDLPLPQGQPQDASFDTSENQFLAVGFENPVDQEIATNVPPVGVDALMKLNAVTWRSRLAQTIDLVQEQLNQQNIDSDTRTSLEVNLRLLDVLSRQMGDIVENQQQFSSSENQYWQDQLEAITSMLKLANPEDARANELMRHHTAHETLTHLRNAVAHLESLANLRVVAGEFATEVSGYGQFKPFSYNVFPVGQKVLVYCEVENFNSTPQESESGASFLTKLRGSYAIYNSSGHAVQQAEFPTLNDVARKRRRDFYMHLPITIGNLEPGNYELHLLVEDLGGNKTASLTPSLQFTVEGKFDHPVIHQAKRQ